MEALCQEIPPTKYVVIYDIRERKERDFFRRRIVKHCAASMITNSVYLVGKETLDLVKTFAGKVTSGIIEIFGAGNDEILLTWDFWNDDTSIARRRISRWIEKMGVPKKLESTLHLSKKFEEELSKLLNKLQAWGNIVKSYVRKIWEYPVVEEGFDLTTVSEVVSAINTLYGLIKNTMKHDNFLTPKEAQKVNFNTWENIRELVNTISEKWRLVVGEIEKEFNFLF
jgi:hypothetical protein